MANQNFLYIKVRVELDKEVSKKKLQEIVQELEYSVVSKTKGVKVASTEIAESSNDYEFQNTLQ